MAKKISKKKAVETVARAVKARLAEPDEKVEAGPHTAQYRFRHNLKQIREHAGYSQVQLGLAAHISGVHVCLMEAGKRVPSIQMLDLLAEFFKVDPREFLKEVVK
jgi:DNA-binding XRE family transcriptional regulator